MEYYQVEKISGLMADLGVSSWQFDKLERGFSFRQGAPLDMRMNRAQKTTAADWLAGVSGEELLATLSQYGQVRNAKTVTREIIRARESGDIMTADALLGILEPLIRGNRQRYLAQVFQAIRIAVNDEIGALKDLLEATGALLEPAGRLVVLSYHSVEDRLVKQFMKTGNTEGEVEKDSFGNIRKTFRLITPKPVGADQEEITRNPRARSARLRIAEKL
jgi:16S rRNA (cytosine1402-N4)-methyltransferase